MEPRDGHVPAEAHVALVVPADNPDIPRYVESHDALRCVPVPEDEERHSSTFCLELEGEL